jgi:hypothetical protein
MKSRLWIALAMATGAAPVAAQTPFQEIFKLQGLYPNDPTMFIATGSSSGFWAYSSPYDGALAPLDSPNSFVDIMVWCVDELHDAYVGQTYGAWITPLSSADFSHTRLGAGERTEYEWAALLAGSMDLNWASSADRTQTVALQDAMWAILGEGYDAAGRVAAFEASTGYGPGLGITSGTDYSIAPGSLNPAQWALVTCDPGVNGLGHPNPVSSCAGQEFLIQLPGGPKEVTPEPGTLALFGTGLVGMIGAGGWRRRKPRIA